MVLAFSFSASLGLVASIPVAAALLAYSALDIHFADSSTVVQATVVWHLAASSYSVAPSVALAQAVPYALAYTVAHSISQTQANTDTKTRANTYAWSGARAWSKAYA